MKPSKVNNRAKKNENEEEQEQRHSDKIKPVTLKGVGCPRGTVPIRRTTKEDIIRLKSFNEMFDSNIHPQTNSEPGLHVLKFSSFSFCFSLIFFIIYSTIS